MDLFVKFFDTPLTLTLTPKDFFDQYVDFMLLVKSDPGDSIDRFLIQTVTLNKCVLSASQHEYLSIEVVDNITKGKYLIFLERTSSSSRTDSIGYFASHPECHRVHQAIVASMHISMTPLRVRDSPDDSDGEAIPLLPDSISSESPPVSMLSQVMGASGITAFYSTQSVHSSRALFSGKANDQFIFGKEARSSHEFGQVVGQLQPTGLTFFDLIILAMTVNEEDPLYSLFDKQCYWFAACIFKAIETRFCNKVGSAIGGDIQAIRIPPNEYLPDLAGRWMGLELSSVSQEVADILIEKLEIRSRQENEKVCY